ncbi:MAG: COP23 domain-containing protein [Cyanobacteria bacterium P01_F01_bin.143]
MKLKLLAGIIASLGLVLGNAIAFAPESTAATENTYYCAQLKGRWHTFVKTPRGKVKLIGWETQFSERWTPRNRCIEVSNRFQSFLESKSLKYIRTGIVNKLPVICVAQMSGGECPAQNVLITFNPETDPEKVLVQLVNFRRSVSGQTIVLSEGDTGFYSQGEFYVDVNKFIDSIPAE